MVFFTAFFAAFFAALRTGAALRATFLAAFFTAFLTVFFALPATTFALALTFVFAFLIVFFALVLAFLRAAMCQVPLGFPLRTQKAGTGCRGAYRVLGGMGWATAASSAARDDASFCRSGHLPIALARSI